MVITFDLDGFKGKVTSVVLNLIKCMIQIMRWGIDVWEGLWKLVPPLEMGKEEAISQ
jgi:hypothetical protein